jgi:hypothetical protein
MAEYLAKVVAIHPPAARRALEKIVGFASEQVGHATTPIPLTRKLNDVPFGHVAPLADTRTPPEHFRGSKGRGLGNPPGEPFLRIMCLLMRAPFGKYVGALEVPRQRKLRRLPGDRRTAGSLALQVRVESRTGPSGDHGGDGVRTGSL